METADVVDVLIDALQLYKKTEPTASLAKATAGSNHEGA